MNFIWRDGKRWDMEQCCTSLTPHSFNLLSRKSWILLIFSSCWSRRSRMTPMGVFFSPTPSILFSSLFFMLRSLREAWIRITAQKSRRIITQIIKSEKWKRHFSIKTFVVFLPNSSQQNKKIHDRPLSQMGKCPHIIYSRQILNIWHQPVNVVLLIPSTHGNPSTPAAKCTSPRMRLRSQLSTVMLGYVCSENSATACLQEYLRTSKTNIWCHCE